MPIDEKLNNETVNTENDAEEANEQQETQESSAEETPTIEQLMTELAKANAEIAKLKNSRDKATSEAAKYKTKLREKQSAEEIQTEEKLKAEEEYKKYVSELESYKKTAEAKARYALQGMGEELATKAAEAEINGDMDELAAIQKKHTDELLRKREQEWLKSRPEINAGNGEGDENAVLEKQIEGIMLRAR